MKTSKIIVFTTLGLGIAAVAVYITQVAQMTKYLFYNLKSVKVKQAKIDGIVLGVKLELENRGRLKADVEGYNLNISANGEYLTTVKTTAPFVIQAFGKEIIEFDAIIDPKLIGNIASVFLNSASIKGITLTTEGTITIKKFGFPIRVPVSYTEKVSDYM